MSFTKETVYIVFLELIAPIERVVLTTKLADYFLEVIDHESPDQICTNDAYDETDEDSHRD